VRIGIDFDHTLVCYEHLFHRAAVDAGLIPPHVAVTRNAVRDFLRKDGREPAWIELQGVVYGARMHEAEPFSGAIEFLRQARSLGHELYVIGQRIRRPIIGSGHDLHAAAHAWLHANLGPDVVPAHRVYFELSKEQKLARIAACGCMIFIDHLPEVLLAPGFPSHVGRWLFDPQSSLGLVSGVKRFEDWNELPEMLGLSVPVYP